MIQKFISNKLLVFSLLCLTIGQAQEKRKFKIHTVAFYNVENLFDTINDPNKYDEASPIMKLKTNLEGVYKKKVQNMAKVISQIGSEGSKNSPAIIGLSEVENRSVVEDLANDPALLSKDYGIIHFDSPDERGIDVALLINEDYFVLNNSECIGLNIYELSGEKDYTRDALYVNGFLNDEEVHIIVCHWPSRRNSANETSHKRIQAAEQINNFINRNEAIIASSKVIIMGDFNDNPVDESIKHHLVNDNLYNPFEKLMNITRGSLSHYSKWHLFDQIIFSHNFFKLEKGKHSFKNADIFDKDFLKEWKGSNKGIPFRTFRGNKYLGGYSDHFPVYINLKKASG